jgi:hypothetical protein
MPNFWSIHHSIDMISAVVTVGDVVGLTTGVEAQVATGAATVAVAVVSLASVVGVTAGPGAEIGTST